MTMEPKQPQPVPVAGAGPEPTPTPEPAPAPETTPEPEPGEGTPPPAERTYSQKEWSERESAKDTEISTYRNAVSQAAMQAQIAQQQQAEAAAQAKDQSDIDQGLITQAEATQRQQGRQRSVQMQPKMEQMGRMMAAQDFGEKYGVNPYELLSDQTIRTPQQMDAKARWLAQSKSDATTKVTSDRIEALEAEIKALKEGEPLFDSGQQGAGGPSNLDTLSPAELTAAAYSPREVARRAKARKK